MYEYNHFDELPARVHDIRIALKFFKYIKPYLSLIPLCLIIIFAGIGLELATPLIVRAAVDGPISKGEINGLLFLSAIFFVIVIFRAFLQLMETYFVYLVGQSAMNDLRTELFAHLLKLPVSYFDKNPSGKLVARLTNDIENLKELFTSGVIMLFGDIFLITGCLVIMFYLDWKLTLISLVVVPFIILVGLVFRKATIQLFREVRKQIGKLNAFLSETISGVKVIKAFNKQDYCYKKFDSLNNDVRLTFIKLAKAFSLFYPAVEFLSAFSIAIMLWYGGVGIYFKTLTFGTFVAFWYCAQKFFQPLWDLAEKYSILQSAISSSERIFNILETTPEPYETGESVKDIFAEIRFNNVNFSYDKEKQVLKDVSFNISPGEKVAIVGLTGSGKTTTASLINRLYPVDDGKIFINGMDINKINLGELRRRIAYIPQDVFLFSGTIYENIGLGDENINSQKIEEVCKYLGVLNFIESLPSGFNTEVGEKGSSLSFGQRQLISFARALSFDPQIIILDEATSSVDPNTEAMIHQALEKLLENRTAIIIAHRLSTVKNASRVIVLHDGRIVESGGFDELVERRGYFYKLCKAQFQEA